MEKILVVVLQTSHMCPKIYHLHSGLQADQIFSIIFIIYTFSISGVAFAALFLCYFQKFQLLVIKKF